MRGQVGRATAEIAGDGALFTLTHRQLLLAAACPIRFRMWNRPPTLTPLGLGSPIDSFGRAFPSLPWSARPHRRLSTPASAAPSTYFLRPDRPPAHEGQRAGLDISSVAHVLFTHFHLDHVGWATNPDGAAIFPNAISCPGAELTHWAIHDMEARRPSAPRTAFERTLVLYTRAGSSWNGGESGAILCEESDEMSVCYLLCRPHRRAIHAVVIAGRAVRR